MTTCFPEHMVLWMAENTDASMRNISMLRGATVRDPLGWSNYINEALHIFDINADLMSASHHCSRWGDDRVLKVMQAECDLYANLNNQCTRLANSGITINQIPNHDALPEELQQQWHTRGYHGSQRHDSRCIVQR